MDTTQVPVSLREMEDLIKRADKELDRLWREMPEAKQKDVTGTVTVVLAVTRKKDGYAVLSSRLKTALPEEPPKAQVLYEGESGWLIDKRMDREVPNQAVIPGTQDPPANVRPIAAAKAAAGKES